MTLPEPRITALRNLTRIAHTLAAATEETPRSVLRDLLEAAEAEVDVMDSHSTPGELAAYHARQRAIELAEHERSVAASLARVAALDAQGAFDG